MPISATAATTAKQTINDLYDDLRANKLSRRRFVETATAAGATAAAATFLANGETRLPRKPPQKLHRTLHQE